MLLVQENTWKRKPDFGKATLEAAATEATWNFPQNYSRILTTPPDPGWRLFRDMSYLNLQYQGQQGLYKFGNLHFKYLRLVVESSQTIRLDGDDPNFWGPHSNPHRHLTVHSVGVDFRDFSISWSESYRMRRPILWSTRGIIHTKQRPRHLRSLAQNHYPVALNYFA